MHNAIMLIKSIFNKNQNHYYYNVLWKDVPIDQLKLMTTNCFVGIIVFRFGKKIVKKGFYGEKK